MNWLLVDVRGRYPVYSAASDAGVVSYGTLREALGVVGEN
jgi:hypothetical protein